MTTIKQANRAIAKAGIPVELVRGDGYHYFIYDNEERGVYEDLSIYVPFTNTYTAEQWAHEAELAYNEIIDRLNRGWH